VNIQSLIQQALQTNQVKYDERTYKRGDLISQEGSVESRIFLVQKGMLRAYVNVEDQTRTIRLAYAPDLIVALDSFYTDRASVLNLECLKSCTVLRLSKIDFMDWLNADPSRSEFYLKYLELFAVQQLEREIDLLHSSPRERYLRLAARSPQVLQEVPHKYIADYLRMNPETLSRLLKS